MILTNGTLRLLLTKTYTGITGRSFRWTSKFRQENTGTKDKLSTNTKPEEKDVIIYRQEPTKYYRILNIFCFSQFTLWAFISSACFNLRDVPVDPKILESKDAPFWKKINYGDYRIPAGVLSLTFGYSILAIGWFYIMRSVQFIVLRKGRRNVSFVTYSPFWKNRVVEYSLDKVSAVGSRNSATSMMPIKIKGNWFHYIIDIRKGNFPHPKLFDQTVGLQRRF